MVQKSSPEIILYLELLAVVGECGIAIGLWALLKRIARFAGFAPEKPAGFILRRISFPLSFLAITAVVRTSTVRGIFPVRDAFFVFQKALFLFFVVFLIVRLGDAVIRTWQAGRGDKAVVLPRVLHGFILAVIYLAVLFAVCKEVLGVNITPFLTTSAILTAILGLALQGTLGNIVSGMALHFTRVFKRGDWVKIGDIEGTVQETNWRETRVLDRASNLIIIPNNAAAAATVTNFSLPDRHSAVTIPIKAAFGAPAAEVLDLIKDAAREFPDVSETPPPTAYLLSYDETGVSYLAKFWVTDYARKDIILTEVGRLIWSKLQRRGFAVPVQVTDGIGRIADAIRPEAKAALAAEEAERNLRDLRESAFLRRQAGDQAGEPLLSEEEMARLAREIARQRLGRGEILFRQGDEGESCYLVSRGRVKGAIAYEEGGAKFASEFEIGPGGLVGEMSLFTGLPRTATVMVAHDAEVLEISAEAFSGLIAGNPALAEAVAEIVSERNRQNLDFLKKIKEISASQADKSADKTSILEHLKRLVRIFRR